MSHSSHIYQSRNGDGTGFNKKRAKIDGYDNTHTTTESAGSRQSLLPAGCKVIVVPVYSPKNNKAKFAFPADLMYENLVALLGLMKNPWNDRLMDHQNPQQQEVVAVDTTSTDENCNTDFNTVVKTIDNDILRNLGITHEMCQGYVEFCRLGRLPISAMEFMINAAAPQELIDRYQNQNDKNLLVEVIFNYIHELGTDNYDVKRDPVQLFASWTNGYDKKGIEIDIYGGKACLMVILHEDSAVIDELRKRIRDKIWKIPTVKEVLARNMKNKETILSIMRDQRVPYYHVPLLLDSEKE